VVKPEERRPLGRPRGRWWDNTKMYHQEEGWAWTGLIWLRTEAGDASCECGNEPPGSIKYGKLLDQLTTASF